MTYEKREVGLFCYHAMINHSIRISRNSVHHDIQILPFGLENDSALEKVKVSDVKRRQEESESE